MDRHMLRQARGAVDLIKDTIDATVGRVEETHQAIVRPPYNLLARVNCIAAPVRGIEQAQLTITVGVYRAIRIVNQTAGSAAVALLDRIEE